MKYNIMRTIGLAVFLLFVSLPVSGQTILNNTTITEPITTNAIATITVASIANIANGDIVYIDNEAMIVTSTPVTGTLLVNVSRGRGQGVGGIATTHADNARVFTGAPNRFYNIDPPWGAACVRSEQAFLPWINVRTGFNFTCGYLGNSVTASLVWRVTNPQIVTYNSVQVGEFEEPGRPWFTGVWAWLARYVAVG